MADKQGTQPNPVNREKSKFPRMGCVLPAIALLGLLVWGGVTRAKEKGPSYKSLSDIELAFCAHRYTTAELLYRTDSPGQSMVAYFEQMNSAGFGRSNVMQMHGPLRRAWRKRMDLDSSYPSGPGIIAAVLPEKDRSEVEIANQNKITASIASADSVYGEVGTTNLIEQLGQCDKIKQEAEDG